MHFIFRPLFFCLALLTTLPGCSTPATRAREHAVFFKQMSTADQRLVLRGRVREGLNKEAVLIAWGDPDAKTKLLMCSFGAGKEGRHGEQWTYHFHSTIRAPMGSGDQWAPSSPFAAPGGPLLLGSAFNDGGPGHDGWLFNRPRFQENGVRRQLVFVNGRLNEQRAEAEFYSFP